MIGDDNLGAFVANEMAAAGIELLPVFDAKRPTTNKNAVEAGGYRLLKMDTVDNQPLSMANFLNLFKSGSLDCLSSIILCNDRKANSAVPHP